MELKEDYLKNFISDTQSFIKNLYANGQLLISTREDRKDDVFLPPGVTHILLIKPGSEPRLIRKRF